MPKKSREDFISEIRRAVRKGRGEKLSKSSDIKLRW